MRMLERVFVNVCADMYVDVFFFAYACVYVWGEWRAACPCLVWLSFTRPLGSRELDSLTAWTGRREREREGERRRRRRGGKKRGGGTLRARRAWLNTRARTHTHRQHTYAHTGAAYMSPGSKLGV